MYIFSRGVQCDRYFISSLVPETERKIYVNQNDKNAEFGYAVRYSQAVEKGQRVKPWIVVSLEEVLSMFDSAFPDSTAL